jgi:hypothetical protein
MQIPNEVQVLNLFGAEYFIDWTRLPRGGSFFLPTTATPGQVKAALRPAAKALDIELVTRPRCEYGLYGVRVWRVY